MRQESVECVAPSSRAIWDAPPPDLLTSACVGHGWSTRNRVPRLFCSSVKGKKRGAEAHLGTAMPASLYRTPFTAIAALLIALALGATTSALGSPPDHLTAHSIGSPATGPNGVRPVWISDGNRAVGDGTETGTRPHDPGLWPHVAALSTVAAIVGVLMACAACMCLWPLGCCQWMRQRYVCSWCAGDDDIDDMDLLAALNGDDGRPTLWRDGRQTEPGTRPGWCPKRPKDDERLVLQVFSQ